MLFLQPYTMKQSWSSMVIIFLSCCFILPYNTEVSLSYSKLLGWNIHLWSFAVSFKHRVYKAAVHVVLPVTVWESYVPACRSRYQLIPVIIGALHTNCWKPITSTYHVIASQLSPQTLLKPFTNQGRRPCSKPPRGMFWKAAWSFPLTRRRPCGSNLILLLGPCTVQLSLSLICRTYQRY